MIKRATVLFLTIILMISYALPVYASVVPKEDTPDYKVSYYAFDCFNMQDGNGKKYGYGYEMMQGLSNYMQCTFSYVGFDKSAKECEEMLKNGDIDIYTAAKKTPEREKEYVFSTHPAITATTCMNVKMGNNSVVPGDYSTYNGLKIGLLERHTYNDRFLEFAKEKGFDCEIVYYATPTELSRALIDGDVDALVNSYIRTPEDEMTVENFGETPYYLMARKENEALIKELDAAMDQMSIETPNWRSDLYNRYYGSQNANTELTADERELLQQLQADHTKITAVMNPQRNPYSWYEDGHGYGIVADIFTSTAKKLGLDYEIVSVEDKYEYKELLAEGAVDIWMDVDSYYETDGTYKYKLTDEYITTTVSVLKKRRASGKINKLGVIDDSTDMNEIISATWPNAEIVKIDSTEDALNEIISNRLDGVLLMSYQAQKVARDDAQNRLSVDIVPGAGLSLRMGINSNDDYNFYGLWNKTLSEVAANKSDELVQDYLERADTPTLVAYLFDNPAYFMGIIGFLFLILLLICMYMQSNRAKNKQLRISEQLSDALIEARKANDAKLNFFSKMSHDIRTPLNAVLGMTQIAIKYKNDEKKLDNALENITSEGNYLLTMINSILDVNQLEHGHVELINKPFNPEECMRESVDVLKPLAQKREQTITVSSNFKDHVVVGDSGRFSQIMVNIVSNAIKYTDIGGKIDVSMESLPGNRYRFTCSDNGIGMEPEYIKHICEDYSRAEDSRTSSTEGTGLGMAVVKGFTELMKGSLKIESKLGEGSTFIVEIPFDEPTIKERDIVMNPLIDEHGSGLEFKGKKVLLAEDNALNAEIAMELLKSIGLIVDWAENGQVAVDKFESSSVNTYFAVFMDMQMPVMDGLEATRAIRKSDREDNDILIFAMTANTLTKDRQDCHDAGMDGYISKPINLKEISSALQENIIAKKQST